MGKNDVSMSKFKIILVVIVDYNIWKREVLGKSDLFYNNIYISVFILVIYEEFIRIQTHRIQI